MNYRIILKGDKLDSFYKIINGVILNLQYITIVYTKEHQTADSYIEKYISSLSKYDKIQVATSDYAEQQIILGKGATRISARELKLYLDETLTKIKEKQRDSEIKIQRNFLEDRLDDITLSKLENIRRKH